MRTLRIWFKKVGPAVYISHLDLYRCFQRATKRAELPVWYTEGFNPKPYLNFLSPLPLGVEGLREPVDIRIENDMSDEAVVSALSTVMQDGLEIIGASSPVKGAGDIAFASYSLDYTFETADGAERFAEKIKAVMDSGELLTEKRSKRGMRTINICERTESYKISKAENNVVIEIVAAAGSDNNLSPSVIAAAYEKFTEISPVERTLSRIKLMTKGLEDLA